MTGYSVEVSLHTQGDKRVSHGALRLVIPNQDGLGLISSNLSGNSDQTAKPQSIIRIQSNTPTTVFVYDLLMEKKLTLTQKPESPVEVLVRFNTTTHKARVEFCGIHGPSGELFPKPRHDQAYYKFRSPTTTPTEGFQRLRVRLITPSTKQDPPWTNIFD